MKRSIIILHFLILGLSGCKEFKEHEGGMLYKFCEDREGETIKEDDFVAITFTERTEEDSILSSSYGANNNLTLMFRDRSQFQGDLFAALGLLSEGDSAVFKINIDSLVAKTGKVRPETKAKHLIYTIKVNHVVSRGNLNDSMYNSRIESLKKAVTDKAKENEPEILRRYIASKSLKPAVTKSGLNYVIMKQGEGVRAAPGDSVVVVYTGRYLNGQVFDTCDSTVAVKHGIYHPSREYGPVTLPVVPEVSSGFQEALMLFPKGTEVMLILPSKLFYGADGHNSEPPYTPLTCEVKIVDIIHKNRPELITPLVGTRYQK
ncbi:MAG: FKBP-type peptidyl-prolyl cis-trans isomerase [Chitinophagaceae bacterium]